MKLRTLILFVTLACFALGAFLSLKKQAIGPVIDPRTLDQLRTEMPMQEVESLLGPPSQRQQNDTSKYPTSETWYYERAFNVGHVEVFFDHDRLLSSVNDESAFPAEYPFDLKSE